MYAPPTIDFIGKTENLVDDLVIFLNRRGYKIDYNFVAQYKKVNVSKKIAISWDSRLKEEVLDSEKMAVLRYYN